MGLVRRTKGFFATRRETRWPALEAQQLYDEDDEDDAGEGGTALVAYGGGGGNGGERMGGAVLGVLGRPGQPSLERAAHEAAQEAQEAEAAWAAAQKVGRRGWGVFSGCATFFWVYTVRTANASRISQIQSCRSNHQLIWLFARCLSTNSSTWEYKSLTDPDASRREPLPLRCTPHVAYAGDGGVA